MKEDQKIRFGLCCLFAKEKISFKTSTFRHFSKLIDVEKLR